MVRLNQDCGQIWNLGQAHQRRAAASLRLLLAGAAESKSVAVANVTRNGVTAYFRTGGIEQDQLSKYDSDVETLGEALGKSQG